MDKCRVARESVPVLVLCLHEYYLLLSKIIAINKEMNKKRKERSGSVHASSHQLGITRRFDRLLYIVLCSPSLKYERGIVIAYKVLTIYIYIYFI